MHVFVDAADSLRPRRPANVLWILANPLDCEALVLWCRTRVRCEAVESAACLEAGLRRCEAWRPGVLVVDPAVAEDAVERGLAALRSRHASHLLVVDRRPLETRLAELLPEPAASYMSRAAGSAALAAALAQILEHGRRVIDPALAGRIRRTARGETLVAAATTGSAAVVSRREREVWKLLAQGCTVAECAELLGLARSTIDNHKSRLMRKLGVHKAADLTRRAIRDGVVSA
jgi:DNA-binding NarL/FixJ family response regulator